MICDIAIYRTKLAGFFRIENDNCIFAVCAGAKFITRNVNFSENALDARRLKRNSKTRWTFTDGENSRYSGFHGIEVSLTEIRAEWFLSFLQGSDPSTYEMIQKIQTLQRRLIQKTEEVCSAFITHVLLTSRQFSTKWPHAVEPLWRHSGGRRRPNLAPRLLSFFSLSLGSVDEGLLEKI